MKTIKLFLAIALLLSTLNSSAILSLSGGGDGTQGNPYKISTAKDLLDVRNGVNIAGGIGDGAAYYELAADIDWKTIDPLLATTWPSPGIGTTTANAFKGSFDGKGFKITGIYAGDFVTPAAYNQTGLFSYVTNATIKNIELRDIQIYVTKATTTTAGGLIGTVDGATTVDNCKVSGVISVNVTCLAQTTAQSIKLGGLIGTAASATTPTAITITNCSADVQLTSFIGTLSATSTTNCNSLCAGILADAGGATNVATMPIIDIVNCYSNGSATSIATYGNSYCGGILGNRSTVTVACKIYNCYSAMSVNSLTSNLAANAAGGGICGSTPTINLMEVKNCFSLNPRIYTHAGKSMTPTVYTPSAGRIAGSKGALSTYDLNYAYSGLDLKAWSDWTGDISTGTGLAASLVIANVITDGNGQSMIALTPTEAVDEAVLGLNTWVGNNPTHNGITLASWTGGKQTGLGNFVYTSALAAGVNNVLGNKLRYTVSNSTLKISEIEGTKKLNIYSVLGTEIKNVSVNTEYSTELKKGIYLVVLEGSSPEKISIN